MEVNNDAAIAASDISEFVETRLRQQFPYMKTERLDQLVNSIGWVAYNGVAEQYNEMQETLQRSSFFSLSAELRNIIYEIVLLKHRCAIRVDGDGYTSIPAYPAILLVCKQLRHEASSVYFGANTFWAHALCSDSSVDVSTRKPIDSWLSFIGPEQCAMIKNLFFDLGFKWPDGSTMKSSFASEVRYRQSENFSFTLTDDDLALVSRQELVKEVLRVARLGVPPRAITFKYRALNDEVSDWGWNGYDPMIIPDREFMEQIQVMAQVRLEVVLAWQARASRLGHQEDET